MKRSANLIWSNIVLFWFRFNFTLFRSFHFHTLHNRTSRYAQTYKRYNSLISHQMRDQGLFQYLILLCKIYSGENSFTCWAFSCATMLRSSCVIFLQQCFEQGLINDKRKRELVKYITEEKVHIELRNLLMMVLVPKTLHEDGPRQAAYLRATVSRVKKNYNFSLVMIL